MELEGSLPHLQVSATCPYLQRLVEIYLVVSVLNIKILDGIVCLWG
jgi:hypothetical protein